MSSSKHQAGSTRGAKKSPNDLSEAEQWLINNLVNDVFGLKGLLSVPTANLTAAERLLKAHFWSKFSSPGYEHVTGKVDHTPEERKALAIAKWRKAEARNAVTNNRILFRECDFGFGTSGQVLNLVRKYIRETIGLKPPAYMPGAFTGGASTRVKRSEAAIAQKFEGKAHVSATALPYMASILFANPGWSKIGADDIGFELQEHSVLFTVPKNSEVDRVACKEPEINVYLQRAAGLFFKRMLKRKGIDLEDQSLNQKLAREGSIGGKFATIDLSSASDTVTTSLVKLVFPVKWFEYLDSVRTKTVLVNDTLHSVQMFSSMGNGFTFELESLLFWALSRAVATLIRVRGKIQVYGDDIIVPKQVGLALTRVMPWFGFILNEEKSFFTGPYRESCGGHYYLGHEVTPVYFRKRIKTVSELIQLGNQLTKWALTGANGWMPGFDLHLVLSTIWLIVPRSLHGGQSLERTDALVTGVSPRQRLVQVNRPTDAPLLGAYLWWLHEKANGHEEVHSPTETAVTGRWVLRPNRSWNEGPLMGRVVHELGPMSAIAFVRQSLSAAP